MLDSPASDATPPSGAPSRLRHYMSALLVLGGIVLLISLKRPEPGSDRLAQAPEDPEQTVEPPRVDPARIPASEDLVAHAGWQREALDYLLPLAQEKLGIEPTRMEIGELAALPFAESRGRLVEVEGTVVAAAAEEYAGGGLFWVLVVDADDGSRALVIKPGLASDPGEGRPEDALEYTTEYIQEGDRVRVRGLVAQRRTGTFGGVMVGSPVPVILAQPPAEAFRKVLPRAVSIDDPGEADWDEVEDRFLADTKNLDEPALYQILDWARRKGHAAIVEEIRDGTLEVRAWDQDTFVRWSEEVESDKADAPRPLTEFARGKLYATSGLVAYSVLEGWSKTPRAGSAWGIDDYFVLGIYSDHYGNTVFKAISAFPLSEFEGVTGETGEHVRVYGYFLKNHTWGTRKGKEGGGRAEITMPFFVVVHAEPVTYEPSPYRQLIWIIAGVIVLLAILFYTLLIRGERKEAARMQSYRTKLKRRIREAEAKRESGPKPDVEPPSPSEADGAS